MTMKVLKNNSQIRNSRAELIKRGISSLDSPWIRLLRRLGLAHGLSLGDHVKSWDVLETIESVFQEQHQKLLEEDVFDLDVKIEVLNTQLKREGIL